MSNDKIGDILHFWEQVKNESIQQELFELFADRMMEEVAIMSGVHTKVVLESSFKEISRHASYNFSAYVFVKVFRCRVPIHSIEDLFYVVWNSPAERKTLFDKLATTFIRRVEKELKKNYNK
jgi:hypothetical protein